MLLKSILGRRQHPKDKAAYENMQRKRDEVGGFFHFTVTVDEDGWHAQCDEIEGIITGGATNTPTNEEIERKIREAIHTAFNIETVEQPEQIVANSGDVAALYEFAGRTA